MANWAGTGQSFCVKQLSLLAVAGVTMISSQASAFSLPHFRNGEIYFGYFGASAAMSVILASGQYAESANCAYRLQMDWDGHLRQYWNDEVIWDVGDGSGAVAMAQGDSGRFLLFDWSGQVLFNSEVSRNAQSYKLSLTNNGDIQIFSYPGPQLIWSLGPWADSGPGVCHGHSAMVTLPGDLPGSDYDVFEMPGVDRYFGELLCAQYCAMDGPSVCKAYTYTQPGYGGPNPVCYLKSAFPSRRVADKLGTYSGYYDYQPAP